MIVVEPSSPTSEFEVVTVPEMNFPQLFEKFGIVPDLKDMLGNLAIECPCDIRPWKYDGNRKLFWAVRRKVNEKGEVAGKQIDAKTAKQLMGKSMSESKSDFQKAIKAMEALKEAQRRQMEGVGNPFTFTISDAVAAFPDGGSRARAKKNVDTFWGEEKEEYGGGWSLKQTKLRLSKEGSLVTDNALSWLNELEKDSKDAEEFRKSDVPALKERLKQLGKRLDNIREQAQFIGTIISIDGENVLMNCRGGDVIVMKPEGMDIRVGDQVKVHAESQQIIGELDTFVPGLEASLVEDLGEEAVVDQMGRRMRLPKDKDLKIEPGSVAIIDKSSSVIIGSAPAPKEFVVSEVPDITWDDIGGLEEAKEEMREAIETSVINAPLYKKFGKKPLRGILLYGPPGCGKTLLAKAAANQLSGGEAKKVEGAFLYVKGPELLSMWVGDTENKIRELFRRAKAFKQITGNPGVIFIDEAESLLSMRGSANSSMMSRTVVPAFLAEWDGLEESGALVILATNRPNDLDEAILREGRIDRKIGIKRPTEDHAIRIFEVHLSKTVCQETPAEIAKKAAKLLFSTHIKLEQRISGALIANLIDRSISSAVKRAIVEKEEEPGIKLKDLAHAMEQSSTEYAHLN
jgi:proteasome-associated ATPase